MLPLDHRLSPHTGWARAHWLAAADHLLASVAPYATAGGAQYRLPGRVSRAGVASDGLEGFARTFLLAACRIAGSAGGTGSAGAAGGTVGGGEPPPDLIARYTRGLIAGTDPRHPFAWPAIGDMSQPIVEAASIAVALHETRRWIFDRLSPASRERVLAWLAGSVGKRTPDSNWVLFTVVIQQFLANHGGPHDPAAIAGGLERIEAWHAGDGWYSDGAGQNFDYYCGWAMLLYPVLWARMSGQPLKTRIGEFLSQYQHFFAADGAPIHQGRSLTYRFATVAPLWAGALSGATTMSPGRIRRIASGVTRHFFDNGAPDERGLLTLGWRREFLPMTQAYSGAASPYWAAKAFLGLLLPEDHPVWASVEEPAEIERSDVTLALPAPGWLLHGTRADGVVRLVNHGSDRADRPSATPGPDPHYTLLAYSTHTGPVLPAGVDNQLTVTAPDGTVARRARIERLGIGDRRPPPARPASSWAASRFADGPVRVRTTSVVEGACEVRVHVVEAPAGHEVREGGHALAADEPPSVIPNGVERGDGLASTVVGLHGFTGSSVARATDASAFGPHAATPFVTAVHPGGAAVYVSQIVLSAAGAAPSASVLAVDGTAVVVRLPSGAEVTVGVDGVDTSAGRGEGSV